MAAQFLIAFPIFPVLINPSVLSHLPALHPLVARDNAIVMIVPMGDRSFHTLAMFLLFLAKSSDLRGKLARKTTEHSNELAKGFVTGGEGSLGDRAAVE